MNAIRQHVDTATSLVCSLPGCHADDRKAYAIFGGGMAARQQSDGERHYAPLRYIVEIRLARHWRHGRLREPGR